LKIASLVKIILIQDYPFEQRRRFECIQFIDMRSLLFPSKIAL